MHPFCPPSRRICSLFAVACLAAAFAAPPCAVVWAASPAESSGYVLLRNGNVLRGKAKRDGVFISVEESDVATVRLPQRDVLCWAPQLEDLYAYRVQHRKPHSLTARFEDLRWAIKQGLLEIARQELGQLRKLAPSDRRVVSMQALLSNAERRRQVAAEPTSEPNRGGDDALTDSDVPATGVSRRPGLLGEIHADPLADPNATARDREAEVAALSRDLVTHYTKRIQPLLINRCGQAGCHGGASTAVWQLEHFGSSQRLPASLTRQNLGNLLPWLHDDQPEASPLLVRATQAHGGRETAPLSSREDELRQGLQAWLTAMAQRHAAQPHGALAVTPDGDPMFASTASHEQSVTPRQTTAGSAAKPTRLPPVKDPFDPADFNRIYHPH
ncbi:hypothetical protein [Roseimaritima ulvae]|uniref:SLA1 homology domain-containing protein n=1 Tax=Roseimaritima ulvae TaxID=980254 RepID=A0A5B9QP36_9BACT|nr:hypothetical protein [Roseimaritima ulvae]QEG38776.1 hypothetical protein UC8_07340 [Roseimaritima ulvae]